MYKKVAIVGFGVMGKNHYNALKSIKDFELVAICDIYNPNLDIKFYNDFDKLLNNEELDALIIASPTYLHYDFAHKAFLKKIDIFIEKPATVTAEQAYMLDEIAKKNNCKSCVGHIERFNPSVKALIKEIGDNEILSISITRNAPFPTRITDVGILTDLSVHDIDLIRFITQKNIIESSIFSSKKVHNDYEDNAILSFKLENDIVANISTSWLFPFRERKISVVCKDQESSLKYLEANLLTQTLVEHTPIDNNNYKTRNCFVKHSNALIDELNAFADYLKTGNCNTLATIQDSAITLSIAGKIDDSSN